MRVRARTWLVVTAVVGLLAFPSGAGAEDQPGAWNAELGPELMLGFGQICSSGGDTSECTGGPLATAAAGLALSARWRLFAPLALGLRAVIGWNRDTLGVAASDGSSAQRRERSSRLGVEGRWYPIATMWVGAEAGVAAFTLSFDPEGPGATSAATGWGPSYGAAIGADFAIARRFVFTPELRGVITRVGTGLVVHEAEARTYDIGTLTWAGVVLSLGWRG